MIFLFAMFLGAGLVLSGCGDDDTATTPAPAPPPPPPPAPEPEPEPEPEPPQAPATPTGLHVDETTETSVGYHWNAVEGAIGYAVQVSMDEMFGEDDQIIPTVETHIEIGPLPPMTSVYVRVAAAAGTLEAPILSDWSTHVTGMTAMPPPPPPPPPPAAIAVTFTAPDGENPMVPDDGTDEETAMATVNSGITVTSNDSAVITPMWDEDAAGVSVMAGDNMPFTFVDWSAKQDDVVNGGVTFMVQRTTMGANQEPEPTGDVAYVTCGPFECMEGEDAPEIGIANSADCTAWDPTFELKAGKVDNDSGDTNTGIDLGWSYVSSAGFTATHDIAVTTEKSKAVKATSTAKSLAVPTVGHGILGTLANDHDNDDNTDSVTYCETSYVKTIGTVQDPGACFRVKLNSDNDYLSNYMVTLDSGLKVTWGKIGWDAFKDLKCATMSYSASDMVDVCDLFAAEVDMISKPEIVPMFDQTGNSARLNGFDLKFGEAAHHRFTNAWYLQSTKDADAKNNAAGHDNVVDIYTGDSTNAITAGLVSKDGADTDWIKVWDADDDPMAEFGDLGMIDRNGDDIPDNWDPANTVTHADVKCSDADGGTARSADDDDADTLKENDGTLCDAEVEFMTSVTFSDGIGQCANMTRDFTVTCKWDADGGAVVAADGTTRSTAPDFNEATAGDSKHAFMKCSVE